VGEARDELSLESAAEQAAVQEQLAAFGFGGGGHSDGDWVDAAGNRYGVSGYGYTGEYHDVRMEVEISIRKPEGAGLPTLRSVTVRAWARWPGRAEAASRELARVLRRRAQAAGGNVQDGSASSPRRSD